MRRSISNLFGASSRERIARALAEDGKKSVWPMVDQAIVSLGNFAINIFLARYLARLGRLSEYGEFGLLFDLMLFLNGIHAALVIYPLTLRGAALDRAGVKRLMSICIGITIAAMPLVAGIAGVTAALLHHDIRVGAWCGLALILWQAQETTRKTLMAELRFRGAIVGDAVSYLGQLACVFTLAKTGHLSLLTTYQCMAVTSAIAFGLQAWQVGLVPVSLASAISFARDAWSLGRWVLLSNLSNLFTGTLFTANFMYWAGKEACGIAAAINNLLRLANPLLIVVGSVIAPHAVRARARGVRAAAKVSLRFAALGAFILTPYLALLIVAPKFAIRFAYGENAVYLSFAYVLIMIACQNFIGYWAAAASTFLNAVEKSRDAFNGQLTFAITMVVLGMPMTAIFHYPGAAISGLIAASLQLAVVTHAAYRLLRSERSCHARSMQAVESSSSLFSTAEQVTGQLNAP
jgi:O-antigen/teichoic acid export membrane protein